MEADVEQEHEEETEADRPQLCLVEYRLRLSCSLFDVLCMVLALCLFVLGLHGIIYYFMLS